MKKLTLLFAVCVASVWSFAQVTSEPAFITSDYNGAVKIIFDATKGNGGMKGATDCYAHTGVITKASTSDSDWKHSSTWKDNSAKYKLTSIGTNLWELDMPNGIAAYYGLTASEVPVKLAFVFRNSTASKEGKTDASGDILYSIYEAGTIPMQINNPVDGAFYKADQAVPYQISVGTTNPVTGKITWNSGVENLTFVDNVATGSIGPLPIGSTKLTINVTDGTASTTKTLTVSVSDPDREKPVPAGMEEGINFNKATNEVTLVFRAPLSNDIYILGDFNGWVENEDYHMYYSDIKFDDEAAPTRLFWRTFKISDPSKKYGFVYKVDGKTLVGDPYATVVLDPWNDSSIPSACKDYTLPKYPTAISGTVVSVLVLEDDNYPWEYSDFKIKDKQNLVIYELLIRDFTSAKHLNGVMAKLDYLKDLGINAIELMPVCEFDGNESWGYNPSFFFAYDKAYGTKTMYKKFIDECHKRGIAVILDMVFNHATGNCPFAKLYWYNSATAENNPWFNRIARHPFNVYHDINHEYEGTRKYFKRVLKYWLEEFKVDGYRMDLVKGLSQRDCGPNGEKGNWDSYDTSRIKILKDYHSAVVAANPNAIFILEHLGENSEQTALANAGMFPWRNMNNAYCQSAMGIASNSGFVSTSQSGGVFEPTFISYAESHDEERNMYKANTYGAAGIKGNPDVYVKRVPLQMAFLALIPGSKMIWEFEEMGYDISINQCAGSTKIDDGCRTDNKPSAFSKKWDTNELRMDAYNKSAKIIKLRTEHPEFFAKKFVKTTNCNITASWKVRRIDIKYVDSENTDNNVDIIVLGNFDPSKELSIAGSFSRTGAWYDYMTGDVINIDDVTKTIALAPGEFKIFTSRRITVPSAVEESNYDESAECNVYIAPTVTEDEIYVYSKESIKQIDVCNMNGTLVLNAVDTDSISLASLPKGMYIVVVTVESGRVTQKVIKK